MPPSGGPKSWGSSRRGRVEPLKWSTNRPHRSSFRLHKFLEWWVSTERPQVQVPGDPDPAMHILGLCADGAGVVAALNGAGNATHLGHVTMSSTICSLGPASHGDFKGTITAANGDRIFLLLTSTTFTEGWKIEVFDVTGGTGRFVDADGEIEERVRLVTQPNPSEPGMWISTGEGWISY